MKVKSLFQIMYYQVTHGKHKTPLHVMNAHAIYEKCRSRELTTAVNKQGTCVSYKSMKTQLSNLAKFTVYESLSLDVPLPSHFETENFSLAAMDNFDNADKSSLSGMKHAHDTVLIVFQIKPKIWKSKPTMTSIEISGIKNLDKRKCQEINNFFFQPEASIREVIFRRPRIIYKLRNNK